MGLVVRYLEFGAIAEGSGGAEVGEGAFGIARFARMCGVELEIKSMRFAVRRL